ncbi:RNA recognition motif domain [Macleaya cordata]|uniref:RNA recognition motif domain n=1 Tax=Macleaya cordata TaxID=56857 RepID=A0A200R4M4_MACCD|nr:RNA recognition motif domain [Macleaya cordata]
MSYSRRSRYSRSRSPYGRYSRSISRSLSLSRSRSRSRSQDLSDVDNPGNNLYVTGLSPRITKKELEKHFSSEGGKVVDIHLVVDPWTRESRGFGFVTMSSVEEADRCLKYLDRSVLEGRVITVEKARRRRGRTLTPGKYLGNAVDLQATLHTIGAVLVTPLTGTGTDPTLLTIAGAGHHGLDPHTADHQLVEGTGRTRLTTDHIQVNVLCLPTPEGVIGRTLPIIPEDDEIVLFLLIPEGTIVLFLQTTESVIVLFPPTVGVVTALFHHTMRGALCHTTPDAVTALPLPLHLPLPCGVFHRELGGVQGEATHLVCLLPGQEAQGRVTLPDLLDEAGTQGVIPGVHHHPGQGVAV